MRSYGPQSGLPILGRALQLYRSNWGKKRVLAAAYPQLAGLSHKVSHDIFNAPSRFSRNCDCSLSYVNFQLLFGFVKFFVIPDHFDK
jgi:hypothetical protein